VLLLVRRHPHDLAGGLREPPEPQGHGRVRPRERVDREVEDLLVGLEPQRRVVAQARDPVGGRADGRTCVASVCRSAVKAGRMSSATAARRPFAKRSRSAVVQPS
jgi:hypothetical protein